MTQPGNWIDMRERNPNYMKRVYSIYRLDKNISWRNFWTYPMGLIYGVITLEFIRDCMVLKKD